MGRQGEEDRAFSPCLPISLSPCLYSDGRWHDPALIDHLARLRKPWEALTRRVVCAVLARFLPQPPGPIVEIGAGGGQLREWLPAELASDVIHTEPSEPFVRTLRERHPEAQIIRADASRLPFEASSVGVVLGLCVFDTLPDLTSVRDELRRVLKPGGVVVHFLDLATSPDCLFPELIAAGELPLTNFARDSALLAVLTDTQKDLLPAADEFDEVLAVPWNAFRAFVGMLEAARHPLAANLGPYSGVLSPGALDPEKLAQGFMAASADPVRLLALNRALLQLTLSARQLGRAWPLRAVSSRTHIRERLRSAFNSAHGFTTEFAGPISAREVIAGEGGFVLRHAGRTITRAELPNIEYGTPVSELDGLPLPSRAVGTGQLVRETTIEVFVSRAE
jgi:SAM-dependent methyltransferase